jgi:hypothetical protein
MQAIPDIRGIFVWLQANDLGFGTQPSIAPYAVAMCVVCNPRHRAIALAQMMINFLNFNSGGDGHSRFDIVSLCYRTNRVGMIGVMFFDITMECAFDETLEDATAHNMGTAMHGEHPVTFWPPDVNLPVVPGSYDALLNRVR